MTQDPLERIAALLRLQLMLEEDHQITAESRLVADLGCDSLDLLEALMGVEDEFGIEISDEEGDRVTTVGDLVALVAAKKVPA